MVCEQCRQPFALGESFCGNCGAARPRIPQNFLEAELRFKQLKEFSRTGDLSEQRFQDALKTLVVHHTDGSTWRIGAQDEHWYRYDGETWLQADPPIQAVVAPEKEPEPVFAARRSPRLLKGMGIILLVGLLLSGAFLAWRFYQNKLENQSVRTAPPITPIESWVVVEVPQFGLSFTQPRNYQQEANQDDRLLWIRDPNPAQALSLVINFGRRPGTSDPETYLRDLVASLPDYQWTEFQRTQAPLGPVVWSETHDDPQLPIFLAVFGPLKDDSMLVFEGQHFIEDWDQARDFYFQVIKSFSYLK